MKFTPIIFASLAIAALIPRDENFTTLTPSGTLPSSVATSSLPGTYALSIKTIGSVSASATPSATKKRRDVEQVSDGQIQQHTDAPVEQISDGQVQHQTTAAAVVNQISDGQVQDQTAAALVNQIGDGQVQQQTAAALVNQIGDGQVQQQTKTVAAVNQISDGQVQKATSTATANAASQISDGQVQATGTTAAEANDGQITATCVASDSLLLTLKDSVLRDSKGRIGSIVANRQFQFDGPPPQAGAIYAAGWSVVPIDFEEDSKTQEEAESDSKPSKRSELFKLALGKQTTFYQCLSGDFYNLYDESIGGQCSEVEFVILDAVEC